jgi:hypothetical protein
VTNLVFHITLPANLALTSGAALGKEITYDVIGQLTPYYASVDQVRLTGGRLLSKLSDITIALQTFQSSQEADLMCFKAPQPPVAGVPPSDQFRNFAGSRNQWVTATAAHDLLLSVADLAGPGSHVLANFSVTKSRDLQQAGLVAKLTDLKEAMKLYDPAIRSGGNTAPGGHIRAVMAAKGVMDWSEITPGRTWFGNGMGQNAKSVDFGSPTGGRGKPVGFFLSPMFSPSFSFMRSGTYQSGFSVPLFFPFPLIP